MLMYNTFIGKDLQEAMSKMRRELGPDAMMLKHRVINDKGFLGLSLFKKPMVEVVGFKSDKNAVVKNSKERKNDETDEVTIQKELLEIKKQLSMLTAKDNVVTKDEDIVSEEDKILNKYIKLLKSNELNDELVEKLMDDIRKDISSKNIEDESIIVEKIRLRLMDIIEVFDPIKSKGKSPKIFMFVGPTGVGKTTSLVKLAANYKLKEEKNVEVYSLDNYRIAATEQLRSYCDIMQIPFKKFDNKIDFKNTLKKSKAEIILIDTAGRSPKDEISISTINDYMKSVNFQSIEVFLVLSAATRSSDLIYISEKYSILNYKYLLFTKLDETVRPGSIIDSLYHLKKPLSYVAFGQDVPKHISIANPEILVESVLKEY